MVFLAIRKDCGSSGSSGSACRVGEVLIDTNNFFVEGLATEFFLCMVCLGFLIGVFLTIPETGRVIDLGTLNAALF